MGRNVIGKEWINEQEAIEDAYTLLDASTHLYKRVRPSVGPERVFLNEPITGEMVGNDWENSVNAPNSSKCLPNCL